MKKLIICALIIVGALVTKQTHTVDCETQKLALTTLANNQFIKAGILSVLTVASGVAALVIPIEASAEYSFAHDLAKDTLKENDQARINEALNRKSTALAKLMAAIFGTAGLAAATVLLLKASLNASNIGYKLKYNF